MKITPRKSQYFRHRGSIVVLARTHRSIISQSGLIVQGDLIPYASTPIYHIFSYTNLQSLVSNINIISQQWEIASLLTVISMSLIGPKTTTTQTTVIIQCVNVVMGEDTGRRVRKGPMCLPEVFTMSLIVGLSVKTLMVVSRLGSLSYHCHVLRFPRRVIFHCIVYFLEF